MTLDEYIESEAQRLFAALGARHGRDIDFYRLMAQRCIAPTPEQMQDVMDAVRRVEEFLGREPVHICYDGIEGLEHVSVPRCKESRRRARRSSRVNAAPARMSAKPH
jgi:hypothetical protein